MNYNAEKNNKVYLYGEIVSEAQFSHEVYGEGFYEFMVKVMRLSGQADILPVTVSERIMTEDMGIGSYISAPPDGQTGKNPNSIVLSGYICKPPVYRTTPFNREIADLLIAVNRSYNKSDYIPAIAWGRNARFVKNLAVGDRVALSGRIQSREYQKKQPDESFVTMTAYEVSISKLAAFDDDAEFDIDEEFDLYSMPRAFNGND